MAHSPSYKEDSKEDVGAGSGGEFATAALKLTGKTQAKIVIPGAAAYGNYTH
jgi:hypothetical protein